jgi:hypothetical protein
MFMKKILLVTLPAILAQCLHAQPNFQESAPADSLYEAARSSFSYAALLSFPKFSPKPQTKGSQYLFDSWVPGSVTDINGVQFSEGYLFNFNKVTQNIYMCLRDSAAAFLLDKNLLRNASFQEGNRPVIFEKTGSPDSVNFYQVLSRGNRYTLYGLTKTWFIESNYYTNGITSTGSMFDEYKEQTSYYIRTGEGKLTELPLKRRAIKNYFSAEKEKVTGFFKEHDTTEQSLDNLLVSLVDYLNR